MAMAFGFETRMTQSTAIAEMSTIFSYEVHHRISRPDLTHLSKHECFKLGLECIWVGSFCINHDNTGREGSAHTLRGRYTRNARSFWPGTAPMKRPRSTSSTQTYFLSGKTASLRGVVWDKRFGGFADRVYSR